MSSDNPSFNVENDELLKIQQTQDSDEGKKEKRGTKSDLIDKIHKICDENGFICEYSPTQLKRLNKKSLAETLAKYIEKAMEKRISEQLKMKNTDGFSNEQRQKLYAVRTLRLLHDTVSRSTEAAVSSFSDYTIEGFTDSMNNPTVSAQIDSCLEEIAEEYEDVVELISNPYTKLALIWGSSALSHFRQQKPRNIFNMKENDQSVEPQPTAGKKTVRHVSFRRPPAREIPHAKPSTVTI